MDTPTSNPVTNEVILFKVTDSVMFTRPHSVQSGFRFALSTFCYSWRFQSLPAGNLNACYNSFSLMWILMSVSELIRDGSHRERDYRRVLSKNS